VGEVKEKYVYDKENYPIFRIIVKAAAGHWFEADVDSVIGWSVDDEKQPIDYEPYLNCTVKWDGCSHLYFGAERETGDGRDAYLHLCGVNDYKNHFQLMRELYDYAFECMKRDPEVSEVW
jgi:hypothetical protein